jgi:hypothetical protein
VSCFDCSLTCLFPESQKRQISKTSCVSVDQGQGYLNKPIEDLVQSFPVHERTENELSTEKG